jgi:hypothetical protein
VLAHLLFALELSDFDNWWALAAGIATAGLVVMAGRFLTRAPQAESVAPLVKPTPAQLNIRAGDGPTQWRPAEPHSRTIPTDVTYKVEETMK